jgi:hypothetical protein
MLLTKPKVNGQEKKKSYWAKNWVLATSKYINGVGIRARNVGNMKFQAVVSRLSMNALTNLVVIQSLGSQMGYQHPMNQLTWMIVSA